jgi:type VI secretion system protein ImpK
MSDQDPPPDPFAAFEADRTVIKPSAGRGGRPTPASPAAPPVATPASAAAARGPAPAAFDAALPDLPAHASLNPLVQAAAPLLSAAPRLRAMLRHPNPDALRASLVESIKRFDASARAQGLPHKQVVAANYILCTLLDESASSTPWGSSGAWSSQSLLVQFHNEASGGEKVFQLLTRLAETPAEQRNLLELMYVVLSLGFEGRYRVLDNGRAQLEEVRKRLAQKLREQAGPADRSLSLQWQGVAAAPVRLSDGVPVWVVAAGLAFLLMGLFLVLRLTLNAQTDATFTALQSLDVKAAVVAAAPPPPAPAAPPPPRLAALLKSDIDAGALEVRDLPDRSIVTLRGDGVFDAGSADVAAKAQPLFERIGAALNQVPGPVIIAGHTDNQPIRSLRFPSNWHLSRDRAASVKALLGAAVKPERLTAEGRADTEPVADNSSPEGRARNRRVEITLFATAPV